MRKGRKRVHVSVHMISFYERERETKRGERERERRDKRIGEIFRTHFIGD